MLKKELKKANENDKNENRDCDNQLFSILKNEMLKNKSLYEDKDFPANDVSLFGCNNVNNPRLVWKRPHVSFFL